MGGDGRVLQRPACHVGVLDGHGVNVSSHLARERVLTNPRYGVPANVYDAYRNLNDQSRDARYEFEPFTAQDVRDLLDQELAAIAAFTGM